MFSSKKLNCYELPPTDNKNVSLPEIEQFCLDRIELHQILQLCNSKHVNWAEKTVEKIKKSKFRRQLYTDEDIDTIQHFLLRLVFSQNDENVEYFIQRELEWFHLRYFQTMFSKDILLNEFHIVPLNENDCKIHFTNAFELLESRKYKFRNGFLYFNNNEEEILKIISTQLKRRWKKEMLLMRNLISNKEIDERFLNMLPYLTKICKTLPNTVEYLKFDGLELINENNIDKHATDYFPPCMKHIHEVLKTTHHVKYDCRMQLGVFLRSIGMPYKDALNYWRQEFTKAMPEAQYVTKYQYLFKHHYGQVGNRFYKYPKQTCRDIINKQVGCNQHHGCPFKIFTKEDLTKELKTEHITDVDISEMIDLVEDEKYQEACTLFLKRNNDFDYKKIVSCPKEFYEQSNFSHQEIDTLRNPFFFDDITH